jgi:DsbC/DsbD-like thiol-disulfide interchange protein
MASMNRRHLLLGSLALAGSAHAGIKPDTRVTLLGGEMADGAWQAGIDIDIGPEWKTYWRMPGDAGIPPDFDWSGSTNLKGVEVIWPAPGRFHDAAGESVGYKTHVLFPLRVTPLEAGKPVGLALKMFFAVCKDVCIPSNADAALTLERDDPGGASRIAAAAALAPAKGSIISTATAVLEGGAVALKLAFAQAVAEPFDVFVEGAEPGYVREPVWAGGACTLAVAGLKDVSALRGKTLRFTMAGGDIRLEQDAMVA